MKKNKFGKQNLSLQQELEAEISQELYLSKDVVKQVLDTYIRKLREKIIERGEATIKSLFSVKTHTKKAHTRTNFDREVEEYPETKFLSISLSRPLRDEFRRKHSPTKTPQEEEEDILFNPFADNLE